MYMDTDTLRWFQQVADGVTVTEISDLSAVTQPGVSRALQRLEAGNYGHCEGCGKPIGTPRLEAMPAARFCIADAVKH